MQIARLSRPAVPAPIRHLRVRCRFFVRPHPLTRAPPLSMGPDIISFTFHTIMGIKLAANRSRAGGTPHIGKGCRSHV